ncbi:hypothetical protein BH23VER1_BH23VER1_36950 [soil metagenome]
MASLRTSPTTLALLAGISLLCPPAALVPEAAGQANAIGAGSVEPADVYLQAYLYMQEAEKLLAAGQHTAAYYKYKDSSDLFDSVARSFPSWNPPMVDYRRRKIREEIASLRDGLDLDTSGDLAAVPPMAPNSTGTPNAVVRPPNQPPSYSRGTNSAEAQIQQRYASYENRIRRLEADRADLKSKLESKESLLRGMGKQLLESKKAREALQAKLVASEEALSMAKENDEAQTLRAQVADLQSELAKAVGTMGDTNERTAALLVELEAANSTIADLRAQQDKLTKERDQLAALITAEEDDPNSARSMKLENMRLKGMLDEAQKSVAKLTADNEDRQEEADMLRAEVAEVRAELARITLENTTYQEQVAELTAQLKMTIDRMEAGPAMSAPEAVKENKELRAIILTQLAAQSRREKAKEYVIAELGKLEADSTKLLAAIEAVAGPPVVMNDAQRELFKDPQFDDFLGGAGSNVHATLIAPGRPMPEGGLPLPRSGGSTLPFGGFDSGGTPANGGLQGELLKHASAGASAFSNNDFQTAEREYGAILAAEPQNVFAMEELAVVKLRLRKFDEAENLLQKAIAYNFENPASHFLLGVTRFRQGDASTAEESLRQSLDLDPANARARQYLGVMAIRRGDTKAAELEFREAITIDPAYADVHFNLAVLYATADEPALALAREPYLEAVDCGAKPDPAMEKLLES